MAIFNALRPKELIVPAPDFSGYRRGSLAVGCKIETVNMLTNPSEASLPGELLLADEFIGKLAKKVSDSSSVKIGMRSDAGAKRIVMLSNPNNPVGRLIDTRLLTGLAEECRKSGAVLAVDESFIPFTSGQNINSLCREIANGSLMVLRSFTKLFAMPGIRLGVLLSSPELIKRVEAVLPEWNISAAACETGIAALKEREFIAETPGYVRVEREYLEGVFRDLSLKTYPSDTNYILTYSEKELYAKLLKRGFLIRDCMNFDGLRRGHYRFAVKEHSENEELAGTLKTILRD